MLGLGLGLGLAPGLVRLAPFRIYKYSYGPVITVGGVGGDFSVTHAFSRPGIRIILVFIVVIVMYRSLCIEN